MTRQTTSAICLSAMVWLGAAWSPAHADDEHASCHTAAQSAPVDRSVEVGLTVPDVALVDQHGTTLHFHRDLIADRLVAINFVFTTCTTVCPPMGVYFARLAELLDERGDQQVQLISVSVDPQIDSPARLRAWSERFGASDRWRLITGDKRSVDDVLKALGVFTPDKTDHAPILLLGNDATGTWQRTSGFTPADVVAERLAGLATPIRTSPEAGR